MFSIINNNKDIYFNLALEEYLLRNRVEDFFMIWQSDNAVVVGKHQNLVAEINPSFMQKKGILPARRITGGGTVFHGQGNLNFTFIMKGTPGRLVNFQFFMTPVIEYLRSLGIIAVMGQRNDLLIAGKKVSGNAEHVFKNRILHHGTLLFNANLEWLHQSVKVFPGRYTDKAVQSFRSGVCNISDYLKKQTTADEFASGLISFLSNRFSGTIQKELEEEELEKVMKLRENKYSTQEWIYGYSPPFEVRSSFTYNGELIKVLIGVKNGKITEIQFSDCEKSNQLTRVSRKLIGSYFNYESVMNLLMDDNMDGALKESLMRNIF
jgi:lipoate-protein ligase A